MEELLIAKRQDMQSVANKLKSKAGKTNEISFPNGFLQIIDELGQDGSSGGENLQNAEEVAF